MNWYRIKTVLIFLFLAINIFLAALLGIEAFSGSRAVRERIAAATDVLVKNGIAVATDIPTETPRLGTLTLENPKANPEKFAERLLGGAAVRLGDIWRREGKSVTIQEKGFTYDSGAVPVEADKKSIKPMKTALENMGFSMEYAKGTVEEGVVLFVQIVEGAPLCGVGLKVFPAGDGTISRIEGVWAEVVETSDEKTQLRSAADALLSFLREGETGSTVTDVTVGYAVLVPEEGYHTADAVPVWQVKTEDGHFFQYDAR